MNGTRAKGGPWDAMRRPSRTVREREVESLAVAFLFAAGGSLALVSLLLPHSPTVDVTGVAVVAASALPVALACYALRPVPWPVLQGILALGSIMISLAVWFSGTFAGAYAFFYLWVGLFAAYFLPRRAAALHIAFAAACYGGLIIADGDARDAAFGWLLAVGTMVVSAVLVRALKERVDRTAKSLAQAATIDDLSGLLNRRGFNERLSGELSRATRGDQSLALIIGDLDRFKDINDRYGHPAGDEALRRVSEMLRRCARGSDVVARLGGEEFAVVLPHTSAAGALAMAERIRTMIRDEFASEGLTISFGIAAYPEDGQDQDQLMRAADNALYSAKTLGRDRIEAPGDER